MLKLIKSLKHLKLSLFTLPAYALAGSSGSGISQVASLATTLQNTITGPLAMLFSIVAIAGAGMAWAMSDHGGGVRKFSAVAIGIVIVVNATSWYATLFGAVFS